MLVDDRNFKSRGAVSGQLLAIIGLLVAVVALGGLSGWLYLEYDKEKTTVDNQISLAVAEATKAQAEKDEEKFEEREKEPNREFAGPEDYGQLSFKYPKTWSVYEASSAGSGGTYSAFLNPIIVPSVSNNSATQYALRVTILNSQYDRVLDTYKNQLKKGEITSSPISVNGHDGTRFDGQFNKNIRGAAVIFKIRDKTAIVQTDAHVFMSDFDKLVETIDFNS